MDHNRYEKELVWTTIGTKGASMDHNRYEKELATYLLVVYSHFMSTLVCVRLINWQLN